MNEKISSSANNVSETSSPWDSLILNENKTRKSEYLESEKGQEELSIEETFDEWVQQLDDKVDNGEISREEAIKQQEEMLESAVKGIEDVRSAEYERAKRQELVNVLFAAANAKRTAEESAPAEQASEPIAEPTPFNEPEPAPEPTPANEPEPTPEQSDEIGYDKDKIKDEIARLEAKLGLVAINADVKHDKEELARDLAESDLNAEVANAKFLKKLWKGTLFQKYYQKKYTKEYLNEERTQNIDGKELTVYDIIDRRKKGAIERFVKSVTEGEEGYIHQKAGESLKEVDAETTAKLRKIIEDYAREPEGADEEKIRRDFEEAAGRFAAEAVEAGKIPDHFSVDNYLEVAQQARERALQHISMDRVMEGFKLYNAEVRDGVRTEAHRDNLDKIIDKIENSGIGQFIPAEVVAGAVSVVSALTGTGVRAMAGVGGGIAASSIITGLRERNRITGDRARLLRDVANGTVSKDRIDTLKDIAEGKNEEKETKSDKYEAKIFGTCYDLRTASDLTVDIKYALDPLRNGEETEAERRQNILNAIAEARVRIDLSDGEKKDLIGYSSEDKRGKERLDLDTALISAEKSLSEEDRATLEDLKATITKTISENIDTKDKDFKKKRAAMAIKKSGKTLALGLATFFTTQELIALADPNKIGILDRVFHAKNNNDASETLLASGFGFNRGKITNTEVVNTVQLREDQTVEIENLGEGYNKTLVKEAWTEYPKTPNSVSEVSPESLADRLRVKYDGWANNGTTVSDGNELSAYLRDGQMVSSMRGISTMGNQSFDYGELAAAGKIKGYLTIGGTKFELASKLNNAGQLTWGENGIFTTTAGETIKAIGDNGEKLYKYFEIAMDNGVDADGIQHIIPFATDAGRNTFSGVIQKAVTEPINHPAVYEFTKTIVSETPRSITGAGIAFAPETARTSLGDQRIYSRSEEEEETLA